MALDLSEKHGVTSKELHGVLFVVATPIGNMDDITFRAVKVLSFVDLVVAEDTRLTSRLLFYYGIKTKLLSMHDHNEVVRIPEILLKIKSNMNVALVSSAGTPLISDPGFKLLKEAIKRDVKIIPVPGVSALITAISVAGLPTDAFVFLGFPAKKKRKRLEQLMEASFEERTLVFYESPKRIIAFINEIIQILGDRYVVLSREMTKIHEEFIRGRASLVLNQLLNRQGKIKGECTLLVSAKHHFDGIATTGLALQSIKKSLENSDISTSDLARQISNEYQLPKSRIYSMILRVKNGFNV